MRKQGLMKRVLGGVMAVAFGAALCFAAPMKAEAATPWSYVEPNDGEIMAGQYKYWADQAAKYAQQNVKNIQFFMKEQMGAQTNIAQTTAATRQYLGALDFAKQAANLVPNPYRAEVSYNSNF